MGNKFDFSGYATKNDLKCADGRTIRRNAFKDCDGITVPLVWQHQHNEPSNVLGHALLENRDDGVYAYGVFNESDAGKTAKELVRHGDIRALSIYANQLVQKGQDVLHGMIREVSLVMAGANPGAMIEDLSFEHFDDEDSIFDAIITNGDNISDIAHADKDDGDEVDEEPEEDEIEEDADDEDDESDEEDEKENKHMAHGYDDYMAHSDDLTIADIFDGMTEEEKNVVYYLIGEARKEAAAGEDEEEMAHNVFENDNYMNSLSHAEIDSMMSTVIGDAKKFGTLKDSYEYHMSDGVLAHAIDTTDLDVPTTTNSTYAQNVGYGINGVDFLFPDARTINDIPEFVKRDNDWVNAVLNSVHKTPFSRIKSIFANITEDEARAKGYLKATQKKEEFFSLMKRTTVPQTIYKKQKMDRDDIIDITDFDVVAWIKSEMRMMLNEEIGRAILVGDARGINDDGKISEEHIRPIVSDAPFFTIKSVVTAGTSVEATAKNFMKAALMARKDYKGSGNPTLFTTEENLTNMLLIEDGIGHPMYKSEAELATALRVSNIITVPVMEGYKDSSDNELMGIIVNLKDYNVGADKGGEVNMFDDFNIDYNQYIYLIETRCSGALIKPYAAIALFKAAPASSGDDTVGDNQ